MILNKIHRNKKGVTLLELILVLALSVIIVGAASSSLINGTKSYATTRNISQALNLSNDILEGLKNEIQGAYFAKVIRGANITTNSSNALTFAWTTYDITYWERPNYDSPDTPSSGLNSINVQYQYLIFVDQTNNADTGGKVMCQSRSAATHDCHFQDVGSCYQIPSKYYENMKITNLKFESVLNNSYGSKFNSSITMTNGVVLNRRVENVLRISFEVRQKTTNKLYHTVSNFSIVLENVMTNTQTEFNSKYINYNTLRVAKQDNGSVTVGDPYRHFLFTKTPCE